MPNEKISPFLTSIVWTAAACCRFPAGSLLRRKIWRGILTRLLRRSFCATEMPEDRPALSADEKEKLRAWIDAGAIWPGEEVDPLAHMPFGLRQQAAAVIISPSI